MSLNKVCLIGNLGQDPEIRYMPNGNPVANFSLATSEKWKDKQTGEKKEKTEWHRVSVFGPIVDAVVAPYVKKGSKLYIEGKLQTRKWQNNDGVDQYTTEIVLQGFGGVLQLLNKVDAQPQGGQYQAAAKPQQNSAPQMAPAHQQQAAPQYNRPAQQAAPQNQAPAQNNGPSMDFDDNIPF